MQTTSNLFFFDSEYKVISCEVSQLCKPDFLQKGGILRIRSVRTGKVAAFIFNCMVVVEEELVYWRFIPTVTTLTEMPHLAGWVVKIYND